METNEEVKLRILQALADESEELARILALLGDKIEITRNWLPRDLSEFSKDKRIKLAQELEQTIAQEIMAVTSKEKAIADQFRALGKRNKPCQGDGWCPLLGKAACKGECWILSGWGG